MPETEIERTIYKLELDGSAYIEGADKLAASTNKLSQAQEAANKKLAELKTQQASYKKELDSVNAVLKANEKETVELTKRLNDLKAAEKGTSAEAKALQTQLRGITTNTKEFKIEAAALKANLAGTTTAIKVQSVEMKAAAAASANFTKGLSGAASGLRTLANIIPGVGIAGLVTLIAGPLVNALGKWYEGLNDISNESKNLAAINEKAGEAVGKVRSEITELTVEISEAKKGYLDKDAVLKHYNETLGKTLGATNDLNVAEKKLIDQAGDLITLTFLKAKAQAAAALAAEQATKSVQAEASGIEANASALDKLILKFGGGGALGLQAIGGAAQNRKKDIDEAKKQFDEFTKLQQKFLTEAIEFAKTHKLNFFEPDDPKKTAKDKKQLESDFEKRKADLEAKISALVAAEIATEENIRKQYADKLIKAKEDINRDETTSVIEKGKLIALAEKLNYLELEKALTQFNKDKAKIISDAFIKEFDERDAQDKILLQQQIDAGAASIKALTDQEKAKYAAMKTPVPFQGATKDENAEKKDQLADYANAVKNVADSVIEFWQAVNEAEAKALDYSISLQEKRVDAAQKLADRGNAQYLKAETDRLNELNVQKENAARKQLGINAALQSSEIIVALITGIAQGAKIGGPLGAIVSVAAITAAIAGAFAIVESLKPPEPTFFLGTKDTGTGGKADNKGGFAATLHPNEAVIPAETNKAYHPAIAAIYDHSIPAEDLNNFVSIYHKIKPVAQPNYERIRDAAVTHIENNGAMGIMLSEQNRLLKTNNDLQERTISVLKKLGVNVSLDRNGFAVSQMEAIEQLKRDRKI